MRIIKDTDLRFNIEVTIQFHDVEVNPLWEDNKLRNSYKVTVVRGNEEMEFKFWDSLINKEKHIIPSIYDVLACLTKYPVGEYSDFLQEFGLKRSMNNRKMWEGSKSEYAKLRRLFPDDDEFEQFSEKYQ